MWSFLYYDCQVWTIVPGFAFAFSGEVLRILLGVSRITAIRKSISTGDTLVEEESDAWETDSKRSTKTIKTRFKTWLQTIITPARAMVWEYILVASPFITSLPAPFITAQALARKRWRGVHGQWSSAPWLNAMLQMSWGFFLHDRSSSWSIHLRGPGCGHADEGEYGGHGASHTRFPSRS